MNAPYPMGSFKALGVPATPFGLSARLLNPTEPSGWSRIQRVLVASGALYVMTYDDFVDRFGLPDGVITDATTGERTACRSVVSIVLDAPLCGGCDAPVSRGGYCIRCDEDHANLVGSIDSKGN